MLNILGRNVSEAVFDRLAQQGPLIQIDAGLLMYGKTRKQIHRHGELVVVASGEKYEVIAQPEVVGDQVPELNGIVDARLISKPLLKRMETLSQPGAMVTTPTFPQTDGRPGASWANRDTRYDGRRDERPAYRDRDATRPTLADAFQRSTLRRSS